MWVRIAAAGAVLWAGLSGVAQAEVLIQIDKSAQRMTVSVNGAPAHVWPVSTGRAGYGTPNGQFRPQWMARRWFSRKYYNSPMPYSIFFHKGYAIHGTNYINRLGGPASHGCVRLHPGNAATLFALVNQHGKANTRIVVSGGTATASARRRSPRQRQVRAMPRRGYGYDGPAYAAPAYRVPRVQPRYYLVPDGYY